MWSSSRRVLQDLLTHVRCFSQTTCKNTVVVERWWQVPLSKEGRPPRLHPRRHRIYRMVDDTKNAPREKMELILTQTVAKLGGRGDTVLVKKSVGRNKLLPQGLAVYPSPENKQMFAEELRLLHEGKPEDRIQTRTGQLTVEFLKRSHLRIEKGPSVDYELNKEIVCRYLLKKLGVVVPFHALRLPDEPIKDLGDYWCEVTVNGIDTVRVPMSLVPFEDKSASWQRVLKKQRQEQVKAASTAEVASSETVAPAVGEQTAEAVMSLVTPHCEASTSQEAAAGEVATEETAVSTEASAMQQTTKDQADLPTETPKKD
ncbi:large ribosomal subunit protein bL9m [Polymixia lowei]